MPECASSKVAGGRAEQAPETFRPAARGVSMKPEPVQARRNAVLALHFPVVCE